jgi:D-amino peptidase
MKILIAADMEGISGVVHWDHVDPQHTEYGRFRKIMTEDVNAAIRGAIEGGATEVVVSDAHGDHRNILIEELDSRAHLFSGAPSPLSMVQGADTGADAAMLVGYHARAGTRHAILDHTWSSSRVANVWINGQIMGEIGWSAAVCGHFGLPVLMVSGDQAACNEAVELLGSIEIAVVKRATGRMSAELLPLTTARQAIAEAARLAVERMRAGGDFEPFRVDEPVVVKIELVQSQMADRAAGFPGAHRLEGKCIELRADDALAAYQAFSALTALARP